MTVAARTPGCSNRPLLRVRATVPASVTGVIWAIAEYVMGSAGLGTASLALEELTRQRSDCPTSRAPADHIENESTRQGDQHR